MTNREQDIQHYWRVMQMGIANVSLTDYQDDLEVIRLMTDSPVLKSACERGLRRFDSLGRIQRKLVAG